MRSTFLKAAGWIALHFLHLLWRVLSLLGSRWAKKKLAGDQPQTSSPLRRAASKIRPARPRISARQSTTSEKDLHA